MRWKKLYTIILAIILVVGITAALYYITGREERPEEEEIPPSPVTLANITGTVTAEDTELPVEGAKVTLVGRASNITDSNGVYLFIIEYNAPTNYTIMVEAAGYVTKTLPVHVTEATEYTVDFLLKPSATAVYLVPSEIRLNTAEVSVGYRFNVTAWVSNVDDLLGFQVALYYDASVINMTKAWLPTWNSSYVFYEQNGIPTAKFGYFESWGYGFIGFTGYTGVTGETTPFNGTGTLAVFEFEIIAAPPEGSSLTSDLIISPENSPPYPGTTPPRVLYETSLYDPAAHPMEFTATDGSYEYIG